MTGDRPAAGSRRDLEHQHTTVPHRVASARPPHCGAREMQGNRMLYEQAARYLRRPAPARNLWPVIIAIAFLAGCVITAGMKVTTGTWWGIAAFGPWYAAVCSWIIWAADH